MSPLLILNIIVLAVIVLYFLREEWRFRSFAKHVSETKEDLTSIVHQMRSPLANLWKYNEFLQSKKFGALSVAQQEALSRAQKYLSDSLFLMQRLLARSRLDESATALQHTSLKMRDVLQAVVHSLQPAIDAAKQTVSIKGGLGVRVNNDPLLLHGIFEEIIANAVYYTPAKGRIMITIGSARGHVMVDVSDTGIGISKEEQTHLFEKFYRGDRARAMHAGNGLGLPFAKQFLEKIGGAIRFVSQEKQGTTVVVTLPKHSPKA